MSIKMPLAQLISVLGFVDEQAFGDIEIGGLASDSRDIAVGDVFLAYPGFSSDGRNYIESAQTNGAAAVLYQDDEHETYKVPDSINIPVVPVPNLRQSVGLLAHHFFGRPSEEMQIFGVTGTNGKTTCCYLLTQALSALGMQAAMIGTIGLGRLDDLQPIAHTTPDAITLHRTLAEWRDQGITQVCMEVSSHALMQARVAGVKFFCTLFTNLSHDHLDYHGDMSEYAKAKQKLFTEFRSELVISNADDELGAGLIDIANSDFIASYGAAGDVSLIDVDLTETGMRLSIQANELEFQVQTPLIGKVNIPNVLMLVTTLLSLSTSVEEIQTLVNNLQAAPGRMELHKSDDLPNVVIDYAHTPDALEKALDSVQQHCRGDLWCVFGCGGDRDAEKRSVMGGVAVAMADQAIITNDNPRSEEPQSIADQIMTGIDQGAMRAKSVQIVLDRACAIATAINQASANDWVVVAGKGHETTQQIGDQVQHFSDREQVMRAMERAA